MTTDPTAAGCTDPCIACMTDEPHDPAPLPTPNLAASAAVPSAPADADLCDRVVDTVRGWADEHPTNAAWVQDCHTIADRLHADAVLAVLPPPAYRRLLARLEADRAGHLRAAGQAEEELLRIDGAVSASTLRHAAARVVAEFEGPDAAQAYMQRTEGGEEVPVDADLRERIEVWPLKRVLAEVRCGSSDWTWEEEWADLDRRHAETGYLAKLEQQIRENGITMPVLIGSDGRLWDGHHRLRIAVRLGVDYVPVEIVPAADPRRPFDVEAGLQRLADDLQRGEAGDGPAPGRAPTDAERRDRYSVAIHEAGGWVLDGGQHMLDAVIAVADTEQADLRALILDYENRITWDTTCGSCARILDSGNRERERAERSEAALDQVRAVISEIDTEMRTEPDTQRSAMQMETVTRIGAAIGDVAPGEQADRVLDERVAAAKEQPVGLPPQLQAALDVMAKRGRVVELTARRDDPDVVAYRNSDRPGVLLCREHGDGWMGLTPLTSDDLPDGGLCTECGVDVLIPQQQAGDGR